MKKRNKGYDGPSCCDKKSQDLYGDQLRLLINSKSDLKKKTRKKSFMLQ